MTTALDLQTHILRYYQVEHWAVGTIARQLRVHHSVVSRVLNQAGVQPVKQAQVARPRRIDPYLPFILQTLQQFPTLTSTRLHTMVQERGYVGGRDHFRHIVSEHRPRPVAQAYLRLRTLPGEQAQVDWAHFGHLEIGRARRPLMAFVMVLSYSRAIFLHFCLNARMDSFLTGHALAFAAWGGVPRVILCDNLKSAVLERAGDAIRFNPQLLAFAAHHRYEPRPVAVARGNEKGRVERSIRYIRDNFFAARRFKDVDDLNAQAQAWCLGPASDRPWHEDGRLTVAQAFEQERTGWLSLPEHDYPLQESTLVAIGKTPYARFDLNDYSLPHTHVARTLTVLADPKQVRIVDVDGQTVLAQHRRSYDKGSQIEDQAHVDALLAYKRGARQHQATNSLAHAVPLTQDFLRRAASQGYNLRSVTAQLNRLLDQYGAPALHEAITTALARDAAHPNTVREALEFARAQRNEPPVLPVALSDSAKKRDVTVRTHSLASYDVLQQDVKTQPQPQPQPEEDPS